MGKFGEFAWGFGFKMVSFAGIFRGWGDKGQSVWWTLPISRPVSIGKVGRRAP
jgi:hypothetical protein